MPGRMLKIATTALFVVLANAPVTRAQGAQSIIAVFDVEDQGAGLSAEVRNRLSDFLAMRLASTGAYQVVPRAQLRQRLVQQKTQSYKQCYDQTCQIEIGKELAAQKSLSTQVVKLGSRCMVTSVLYDLKRSASEGGGSAEGGCDEDAIVGSLKRVLVKLTPAPAATKAKPAASTPRARRRPRPRRASVTIDLRSTPAGAEVFVDGHPSGTTPTRLVLPRGLRYAIRLEKRHYHPVEETLVASKRRTISRALVLNEAGRARLKLRTEWLSVELLGGVALGGTGAGSRGAGGAVVSIGTLKWNHIFWVPGELGGSWVPDSINAFIYATRVGYPIYLGDRGAHQFRFSVGLGPAIIGRQVANDTGPNGKSDITFMFSPTIAYQFQTSGRFFIGAKVRTYLPAVSGWFDDYPWAATFSLVLGWSARP